MLYDLYSEIYIFKTTLLIIIKNALAKKLAKTLKDTIKNRTFLKLLIGETKSIWKLKMQSEGILF